MLAKFCKRLWLKKAGQKNLEIRSSDKTSKNDRPGMNMVEYDSQSSDDEGTDMCVAE